MQSFFQLVPWTCDIGNACAMPIGIASRTKAAHKNNQCRVMVSFLIEPRKRCGSDETHLSQVVTEYAPNRRPPSFAPRTSACQGSSGDDKHSWRRGRFDQSDDDPSKDLEGEQAGKGGERR